MLYTTFVETLSRSMHGFFWSKSVLNFQTRRRLKFIFPCGIMLTKTKTNLKNAKKMKNKQKWSGDMVKRYISTKFGINLLDGFWGNGFYGRTNGWTD